MPKQRKANGLKEAELAITEDALKDTIRYYTREAGVRGLERDIAKICRKTVTEHVRENKASNDVVGPAELENMLGVRRFDYGRAEAENQVGQVTGLAWTQVGGELLTIEASAIPGKGRVIKTGSLGDVMQHSHQLKLQQRQITSLFRHF